MCFCALPYIGALIFSKEYLRGKFTNGLQSIGTAASRKGFVAFNKPGQKAAARFPAPSQQCPWRISCIAALTQRTAFDIGLAFS
jgi:hypothetical protein